MTNTTNSERKVTFAPGYYIFLEEGLIKKEKDIISKFKGMLKTLKENKDSYDSAAYNRELSDCNDVISASEDAIKDSESRIKKLKLQLTKPYNPVDYQIDMMG